MSAKPKNIAVQHITIRVPWHDSSWNGNVCTKPKNNTACLCLKRISEGRDTENEEKIAGKKFELINSNERPPCQAERVAFMSERGYQRTVNHAYEKTADTHKHYRQTIFHHDAFSAAAVPYRWMMLPEVIGSDEQEGKAESLGIVFNHEKEPAKDQLGFETIWVQEKSNQLAMLDSFFSAFRPNKSLCFFYAKKTPFSESSKRVIVGVGYISSIGGVTEYNYDNPNTEKLRSVLWERNIYHSIRSDNTNGFLLPYHEFFSKFENDTINSEDFLAFAPDEYFENFSYGSENLNSSGAILSLLSCYRSIEKMSKHLEGNWVQVLKWINDTINSLWTMRGPFPGFGSALAALGVSNSSILANEINLYLEKINFKLSPWEIIYELTLGNELNFSISNSQKKDLIRLYSQLLKNEERLKLLHLLSRFDLDQEQSLRFFQPHIRQKVDPLLADNEILLNPYLIFEKDRMSENPISFFTVDQGLYAIDKFKERFPIAPPTELNGATDPKRVRGLFTLILEKAKDDGHTFLPINIILEKTYGISLRPPCAVGEEVVKSSTSFIKRSIKVLEMADGNLGFQTEECSKYGTLIRETVTKRKSGKKHEGIYNWRELIDRAIGSTKLSSDIENKARSEKAEALRELFKCRISVLIGPAGTGKTTLLRSLLLIPEIMENKVLMLAPTGKARVRLEKQTGNNNAKTVAQFLNKYERYDSNTGNYIVNDSSNRPTLVGTLIIDECSMLTEQQLASVFDAIKGARTDRIILVGDHRQLPPIGAGKPFYDIIQYFLKEKKDLSFPKITESYAELTIGCRQIEENTKRGDVTFAELFKGGDEKFFWDTISLNSKGDKHIKFVQWNSSEELQSKLNEEIKFELGLSNESIDFDFEKTLGGSLYEGSIYFHAKSDKYLGTSDFAENWQVLTPVRAQLHGTEGLNRYIQHNFRKNVWKWIKVKNFYERKVSEPMGSSRIIYGDKVICTKNEKRRWVWPRDGLSYVANGDIGVVVGEYKNQYKNFLPKKLEVEFSSQAGFKYDYNKWEFGDDSSNPLELAYALTVHKSQGSQFGKTFVVLPNPCHLISRELIYTALTRHTEKIIVLHQGELTDFFDYTRDDFSEIKKRLTNLFETPSIKKVNTKRGSAYYEERLIHASTRGELMRSKSEVIIANILHSLNISYFYEESFTGKDGVRVLPDFQIIDSDSGEHYIWEHLGMLEKEDYRLNWERKLTWYLNNGFTPEGGAKGTLIVTVDNLKDGIDTGEILKIAKTKFLKE